MLTAFRGPDNLKNIGEWLKAVRRPARQKYAVEWFRTVSAGAILLGLLNPELVGGKMWVALFGIGFPAGLFGFWLTGKDGDK